MDHPWRPPPPPPVSGNISICPICSISHSPFCPPPPFIENPRFHNSRSHSDQFYQRPLFDHYHPFPDRPSSLDYNHNYNPSDAFVDRRPTWHNSHLDFDMPPNGGLRDSPMDNRNYNNYHKSGVGSASYGYDNYDHGAAKRMRVETVDYNRGPSTLFISGEDEDSSRFPSAHERISKLIHDHGNLPNDAPGGLSQIGANLFSESKSDNATGYVDERLIESYGVRGDMGLKRRREMNDSQNNGHYDLIGELGSQYGRIETLPNSLNYRRHSSQQAEFFTDTEHHEQTQDHYGGKPPYHSILQKTEMKKATPLQQDVRYRTTETLHDNYHNSQPLIPSEAAIIKEPNYSNHDILSSREHGVVNQIVGVNGLPQDRIPSSLRHHSNQPPYGWAESKGHHHHHQHSSFGTNFRSENSHAYSVQPPSPASPPPPLPTDQPRNNFFEALASPLPKKPSLFPIGVNSSAELSSSRPTVPENQSPVQAYYTSKVDHHASTVSSAEEFHTRRPSFENYAREVQPLPLRNLSSRITNIIDASHIFKQPHRTSRPDHLVIILRGLPGSGKSYLAKMLRDLEVENGGEAPRIHSMDEYFMTEVEKAEESDASKSSGSFRGKRPVMKKVMQYCFEPEMEEAYRASMLKAFKKTLDEGVYSFIIVDDRNLRVADFAQFWATAKRSGYEVYLLEASYKDPVGCAARNVHNFTLDDIQKMAGQWEEAPSMYLKLDIKSLLHGDGFDESGIQEVDMDMEDGDSIETSQEFDVKSSQNTVKDEVDNFAPHGPSKDTGHPEESHRAEEVKHLSRSKWSNDLDESESHEAEGRKGSASALSGLIQAYSKEGKSVRWGDQGMNVGFSISATKKTNSTSLIIGPGSGYNLKSNPLSEEDILRPSQNAVEPKRQNVFQERMRAERESFKAVFDKRRQRISGFNADEE